ncbi:hypothetical protein MJO28_002249 [Puccinia striiformis f. sp. tritici]|uniref:Uncharacterized protein n=3 Tax=Puccinia striiformis TaxID=27350 RepID=A0A2S4UFI3_9BASI|nr:hypothetical protein Pst134EA_002528 [Puccinia striiformis f. sp. tritici]KAI9618031.1 hypothetical protein KEM48_006971 [Puccinia striiformis f. sp. tritici PST-130]KNE96831.1 hypothetical protein PSTG_09816 [Puccinia striiformis f. sp. tritici PST-78]POV95946.1 hypothetical protein PSTT_15949 [Puccinia striiformis]KAH9471896.1 hypothetical protein Pst134EA_002528 [Puccinia striiformis f. sp. tritici]KAI7961760.1 hypothetical protein MJO28_002249 [Puccinia striiformis f. sp. tritici]
MTSSEPISPPSTTFSGLFQGALLDGLQVSSMVVPGGILLHQIRSGPNNNLPSSTGSSGGSSSSAIIKSTYNYRITHFLRFNGLFTFGFAVIYAALFSSIKASSQSHLFSVNNPAQTRGSSSSKPSTTRINDYSLIGGTLGGLITSTIFWRRSLISLVSLVPGGIGIGIGGGVSTGYLHPRSPPHPQS